eukprot:NODE_18788_length_876_cov_5.377837.p2 GENE.NODE_18788_length_876_cov_5.377837~~NODE_18788_length_876_cov_5.377837.p2  ORF type:complete len:173 (-),score=29.34 NODE_18788_length_876_cov_5.377837:187-705(-)
MNRAMGTRFAAPASQLAQTTRHRRSRVCHRILTRLFRRVADCFPNKRAAEVVGKVNACRKIAIAISIRATQRVRERKQPAPATLLVAPAPATFLVAPAPATFLVAPAPATFLVAPAPATFLVAPAPATILVAPAPATSLVAPEPGHRQRSPHKPESAAARTPATFLVTPAPD